MDHAATDPRRRLAALTRIAREVDSAADLESALDILVRRTRDFMAADVCSVYFTDEDRRRHVVAATDGLSSRVVGRVTCDFGQGLVGRVAAERRPVNLDRVPAELDQDFLQQTSAEPYRAFLGVPVTHKGRVQGVLLVRQRRARRFDDSDEAFLATLAMQLGGAIAYAKASGEWCWFCRTHENLPRRIDGLPGAPGLGIGQGRALLQGAGLERVPDRRVEDPVAEEARLRAAVAAVRREASSLGVELREALSEADRALFEAYVLMLDSPEIVAAAVAQVRRGNWAPGALRQAVETCARRFDAVQDPYLRERAADVRALGDRVLAHLLGDAGEPLGEHQPTVLVGQRLSALDIGQARSTGRLVAIVSGDGSSLSHAAILARSLGIPAVMGIADLPLTHLHGQELVVDGTRGQIHLRLGAGLRRSFIRAIEQQQARTESLELVRDLDAVTLDRERVALFVNAGLDTDLQPSLAIGAAGIGLYRSELPFMRFNRLPSEREQLALYRQALRAVAPRPVTLRVLDAGGDKPLPYLQTSDPNPALGWRGIRYLLDHPEIFVTQLRACLRADLGLGNLRLLLPMISDGDEWQAAGELLDQAIEQLRAEGLPVVRPPVGAMIEVPAAVYQAAALARRADFLSVGTNDLAQYLLAVDRNNPKVSARLYPAHPAVLQALRQIAEAAAQAGTPVSVCGEMAGDPAMALLLLGMGFDGLSVSPAALPRIKWAVRNSRRSQMRSLAQRALACQDAAAVQRLLEAVQLELGLTPGPDLTDSLSESSSITAS